MEEAGFTLHTERLGPLPLINHFIERIGLTQTLSRAMVKRRLGQAVCAPKQAAPHQRRQRHRPRCLLLVESPLRRPRQGTVAMVKGLDVFRIWIADYPDQYILIGGAAATLAMEEAGWNVAPPRIWMSSCMWRR
jgi:hypothetical protein